MPYVYVSCEVPLIDERMRIVANQTAAGVYEPLDVDTYRRWRPLGYFRRLLVKRERRGRSVLLDENWRRENETDDPLPTPLPKPKRRGCGCWGRSG